MPTLKQRFEQLAADYVAAFEKKQDMEMWSWVSDEVGGVGCFGDYYFTLDNIREDIDRNYPVGLIIEWQDEVCGVELSGQHATVSLKNYAAAKSIPSG